MPVPANPAAPYSKRRRQQVVVLPAEGCELPVPSLPRVEGRRWGAAERALWRELWRAPQAVMWDESMATVVALYVSHACAVLGASPAAWRAQEARHLADKLGLSPAALSALGWRIAEPGETATVLQFAGEGS